MKKTQTTIRPRFYQAFTLVMVAAFVLFLNRYLPISDHLHSLRSDLSDLIRPVQQEDSGEFVAGELIVKLRDDDRFIAVNATVTTSEAINAINREHDVVAMEAEPLEAIDNVYTLSVARDQDVDDVIRAYEELPEVEYVERNGLLRITAMPNDSLFAEQWALQNTGQAGGKKGADIGALQAWNITKGAPSVVIAIVDTGVDTFHGDLKDKLVGGYNFVENNTNPRPIPDGKDNDGDGIIDGGVVHGTHVASIAAGVTNNASGVSGVSWNARIMPVKVLDDEGVGTFLNVAKGIVWAVDKGAHVINLSMSGPYSETVSDAIAHAHKKGVVVVATAGNNNSRLSSSNKKSPVCNDLGKNAVIGVGATDSADRKTGFSNYGSCVDIVAPGQGIYGAVYYNPSAGFSQQYAKKSGTSMAAPIVSGVAALVKSKHPDWSAAQIRDRILKTATSIDYLNPSYVGMLGAGRVDAYRSVLDQVGVENQKIVVGAGPGGGPHVRGFARDGTAGATSFMAYASEFRGGIVVDTGDVDGDGVQEIIVGPRKGGGPHVRVFEKNGSPNPIQFFAFHPSFRGGIDVAAGDVTGNGVDEVIVSQASGGQAWIKVYDKHNRILAYWNAFGDPEVGASVAVGDVDQDGKAEVIVGAGPGGGPHIRVYDIGSKPVSGINQGATLKPIQFFAFHPQNRSGVDVAAGDVDGDGKFEIAVSQLAGDEAFVKVYRYNDARQVVGSFRAYAAGITTGARISMGDVTGNGRAEIVVGPDQGGGPHVRAFRADGTPLGHPDFFAFPIDFRGGVSVGVFK
jgi:thermitase